MSAEIDAVDRDTVKKRDDVFCYQCSFWRRVYNFDTAEYDEKRCIKRTCFSLPYCWEHAMKKFKVRKQVTFKSIEEITELVEYGMDDGNQPDKSIEVPDKYKKFKLYYGEKQENLYTKSLDVLRQEALQGGAKANQGKSNDEYIFPSLKAWDRSKFRNEIVFKENEEILSLEVEEYNQWHNERNYPKLKGRQDIQNIFLHVKFSNEQNNNVKKVYDFTQHRFLFPYVTRTKDPETVNAKFVYSENNGNKDNLKLMLRATKDILNGQYIFAQYAGPKKINNTNLTAADETTEGPQCEAIKKTGACADLADKYPAGQQAATEVGQGNVPTSSSSASASAASAAGQGEGNGAGAGAGQQAATKVGQGNVPTSSRSAASAARKGKGTGGRAGQTRSSTRLSARSSARSSAAM